jgi:tRNA G26 N,N-dimethylase Trm1
VLCPRETHCAAKKEYIFPVPSFWVFFFFFVFFNFLKSLKKNKRMLRYKGGTSVTSKHTSSKRKEHTNAQSKETCAGKGHSGKIPPWVKVSGRRGKVLQGLRIRHASKVQLRETWSRH